MQLKNSQSNGSITSQQSEFFLQLSSDLKIFNNLTCILEKIYFEGNLQIIQKALEKVIENELEFTITQLQKMKQKVPNIEINSQLYTNSLMFKENLKLICSQSIDQIWKKCLSQKQKTKEKVGKFEQIMEVDEDLSQDQSVPSKEEYEEPVKENDQKEKLQKQFSSTNIPSNNINISLLSSDSNEKIIKQKAKKKSSQLRQSLPKKYPKSKKNINKSINSFSLSRIPIGSRRNSTKVLKKSLDQRSYKNLHKMSTTKKKQKKKNLEIKITDYDSAHR